MNGFKDFFDSSAHWIFGLLLIIGATTLTGIGIMPLTDWKTYTEVIFVGVAGSHAVIAVGDSIAASKSLNLDHPAIAAVLDAFKRYMIGGSQSPSEPSEPVKAVEPPKTEAV